MKAFWKRLGLVVDATVGNVALVDAEIGGTAFLVAMVSHRIHQCHAIHFVSLSGMHARWDGTS